jgi:hypothetical protein
MFLHYFNLFKPPKGPAPTGIGARMSETDEDDEFFFMANLYPQDTGLPMVVWASERGRARHDVRVKVMQAHGDRIDPYNLASVAVLPVPHLVAGQLSASDLRVVAAWIRLNEAVLIDYGENRVSTAGLLARLHRLP